MEVHACRDDVLSAQYYTTSDIVDLPNHGFVVFRLRDPWDPIVVDGREDVEHGKNTGDGQTQHPDRQVSSGTNPVAE